MKYDKKYFADKLIQIFPEYQEEYRLHLQKYGRILSHVFFGDIINPELSDLLRMNRNTDVIRVYIDFIDEMYRSGDDDIRNVVEVTILEYLGDSETVLRNAFTYFSEELMLASKEIEADWEWPNCKP